NGRYFYFQNTGLQNQSVLYVQDGLDASPRVLLDPNTLSPDGTVAVSGTAASDDGRYLAYSLSTSGSDWRELHVRDVRSASDLPDTVKWVKFSGISWTHDNKGFFYSRYDEPTSGNKMTDTNRNAPKGRIVAINIDNPRGERWNTIVPESKDALVGATTAGDDIVANYLQDAHSSVRLFSGSRGDDRRDQRPRGQQPPPPRNP